MTGNEERCRVAWVEALPVGTIFTVIGMFPAVHYVAAVCPGYGRCCVDIEWSNRYYADNFAPYMLRRVVQTFGGLAWTKDCV